MANTVVAVDTSDFPERAGTKAPKLRCAVIVDTSGQALLRHRVGIATALKKDHAAQVVALAPFDFAFASMSPGEVLEGFAQADITLQETSFDRRGTNPIHDAVTFMRLVRAMVTLRPELCLAFTPKGIILASFAALLTGVPNRYGVLAGLGYLFGTEIRNRPVLRLVSHFVLKQALRRNTKIIVQNPDHVQFLVDNGFVVDSSHCVAVPGAGVNTAYFAYAEPVVNPVTFLFMSRMYREKGVVDFVMAAELVKAKFPGAVFQLLGHLDGTPDCVTGTEVAAWERGGVVSYRGCASDVRPYLRECSVLVLPSYYQEGLPTAILEAMSTGRAVITTDWPGCREPVTQGVNGLLVPPHDPQSLAKAMEYFLENPQIIATMGRAGRHLAESKFSQEIVVRDMLCAMNLESQEAST